MHLEVGRRKMKICSDNEIDEAYIEEVLGLRKEGDSIKLVRKNVTGMSWMAYLETEAE